jgi:hypothetical protein
MYNAWYVNVELKLKQRKQVRKMHDNESLIAGWMTKCDKHTRPARDNRIIPRKKVKRLHLLVNMLEASSARNWWWWLRARWCASILGCSAC